MRIREFVEIEKKELVANSTVYKIGDYSFRLSGGNKSYYFYNISGRAHEKVYTQFGLTAEDIFKVVGYRTQSGFPNLRTLSDVAKVYNYLYSKWLEGNQRKIKLSTGEEINIPLLIESQEHWDSIWPKLKETGFKWADGEELDSVFSYCHDFPESIDQSEDLKLVIND
jgi:hypothetical protein